MWGPEPQPVWYAIHHGWGPGSDEDMNALAYLDRSGHAWDRSHSYVTYFAPPEAATQSVTGVKSAIELLRFLSAIGIVWFHVKAPGMEVAYVALPIFLLLSSYFATDCVLRNGVSGFVTGRATRILGPWVTWCAIFICLRIVATQEAPDLAQLAANPWLLLVGPAVHLWFLPFLFFGSLLIPFLVAFVTNRARFHLVLGLVGCMIFVAFATLAKGEFAAPFGEWIYAVPSFAIGALFALAARFDEERSVVAMLALVAAASWLAGHSLGLYQLVLGAVLFKLFWLWQLDSPVFVFLGRLSFGIYLVHPVFLWMLYKGAPELVGSLAGVVLVFAASMATVWVLRQMRLTRQLV